MFKLYITCRYTHFNILSSPPCQRQCGLLASLGVRRLLSGVISLLTAYYNGEVFRNEPIRNKNCLWCLCLLTDRDEISNLNRGSSIDAFYQVLVQLAKRFLWKFTSQSIYHFIFLKIHQQFPSFCL
jgi:hypothetical protein